MRIELSLLRAALTLWREQAPNALFAVQPFDIITVSFDGDCLASLPLPCYTVEPHTLARIGEHVSPALWNSYLRILTINTSARRRNGRCAHCLAQRLEQTEPAEIVENMWALLR